MRELILGVLTIALIGCAHSGRTRSATLRELKIDVSDVVPAQRAECPEQLTGYIQGRVVSSKPTGTPVHVIFLMSDDATIDVMAAPDGSFEIPCVYPARSYGLCVVAGDIRSCGSAAGPQATGLRLTVPRSGG